MLGLARSTSHPEAVGAFLSLLGALDHWLTVFVSDGHGNELSARAF